MGAQEGRRTRLSKRWAGEEDPTRRPRRCSTRRPRTRHAVRPLPHTTRTPPQPPLTPPPLAARPRPLLAPSAAPGARARLQGAARRVHAARPCVAPAARARLRPVPPPPRWRGPCAPRHAPHGPPLALAPPLTRHELLVSQAGRPSPTRSGAQPRRLAQPSSRASGRGTPPAWRNALPTGLLWTPPCTSSGVGLLRSQRQRHAAPSPLRAPPPPPHQAAHLLLAAGNCGRVLRRQDRAGARRRAHHRRPAQGGRPSARAFSARASPASTAAPSVRMHYTLFVPCPARRRATLPPAKLSDRAASPYHNEFDV